jgi:hypothetical protein
LRCVAIFVLVARSPHSAQTRFNVVDFIVVTPWVYPKILTPSLL